MSVRVLVVDDDLGTRLLLRKALIQESYTVEVAEEGQTALALATDSPFDVVLLDVMMPELSGVEVLRELKAAHPDTIVIMMTAFGSLETAVQAVKEGAYDYVKKPFDLEEIKLTIQRALERQRLIGENLRIKQELKEKYRLENIVGASEPMLNVYKLVARAAPTRSTVLILGETGTGKELVARAIHYNSPRAEQPFIAIDCSTLSEQLLESELFGHVKGAFTGAVATKQGLFEAAQGGTCFLDEIDEVRPSLQAKLLRVLQEREVRPVGGTHSLKVDVRVVAATNKNLDQLTATKKFREDLFYRLSVVTVQIPPLRQRREDIPLLVHHFARKYATENAKPVPHIAPDTLSVLTAYGWPGNVRELEHVIEQAVALTTDPVLLPEDLPAKLRAWPGHGSARTITPLTLQEIIERHIQTVLKHTKGNKKLAAELLGIPRRTLYRQAKRFGILLGETDDKAD